MDILIGTTNPGKIREYRMLLAELPARLLFLHEVGLGDMEVDEPFDTYEANARHKADAYAQASGLVTLADDSGLEVEALGGRPGVYSARYAGPNTTPEQRYAKLLGELEGVPEAARRAKFVCVIVAVDAAHGRVEARRGEVHGRIAASPMLGETGFGYDPVFIADGYTQSLAQISADEKNAIDHRGVAARRLLPVLKTWMR